MKDQISKEEFQEWKENPVTQAIFGAIKERQSRLKELLAVSAGLEPIEDRKIIGMIAAYNTLLLVDWEDLDE